MTKKTDIQNDILKGLMFLEDHTVKKMLTYLNREWFDPGLNQIIFDIILDLQTQGKQSNIIEITTELSNNYYQFPKKEKINHLIKITNSEFNWSFGTLDYFPQMVAQLKNEFDQKTLKQLSYTIQTNIVKDTINIENTLEEIENTLNKIKNLPIGFIQEKIDNHEVILNIIENHNKAKEGFISGIEFGFNILHQKALIENTDMIVIGARPSMGKTAFAISLIKQFCFKQELNVLFFNLEMSIEQMTRRLISAVSGVNSNKIKFGKMSDLELDLVHNSRSLKGWNNIEFIEGGKTFYEISNIIQERTQSKNIDIIIIDYLQKIKKSNLRQSTYESVTENSASIKDLCMNLKKPIIALAQVGRGVTEKGDKKPSLADIRNSGDIEQDADFVAFLHRNDYYGIIENEKGESTENIGEFIIAKNREGETGTYEFFVNPINQVWSDKNYDYQKTLNNINNNFENQNKNNLPF